MTAITVNRLGGVTMTVTVRTSRRFRLRLWVVMRLLWVVAKVAPFDVRVEREGGQ